MHMYVVNKCICGRLHQKKETSSTFLLAIEIFLSERAEPDKMEYKYLTFSYVKVNVTHLIYLSDMAITQIRPFFNLFVYLFLMWR